jgi:hypothetical protein
MPQGQQQECTPFGSKPHSYAEVSMKTAVATMVALTFSASLALAQTPGGNPGPGGSAGGASSTTGTSRDQKPPLKGANSFTEGEAKSRAEARGFSDIKDLEKDSEGIWRGHAMQDGKQVQIAIDYKGNVVTASQ